MSKTAFVFPGQGSQAVGMGQELVAAFPEARAIYDQADQALGLGLSRIMLEGPEADLNRTDLAQPALLTAAVAAWTVLKTRGLAADDASLAAGHSLGEYSALVAAGALEFEAAVRLVRRRGELMLEASRRSGGGMAAALGLSAEDAVALCREADPAGDVGVANFNCPGQVVLSGSEAALAKLTTLAGEKKIKLIPLKVSGPFHSRHMQPAADGLAAELAGIRIQAPRFPVIANVTADVEGDPEGIRRNLSRQVVGSVRWEETQRKLAALGAGRLVEVGPGKVLRGLAKKTLPEVKAFGAFSPAEIEAWAAEFKA